VVYASLLGKVSTPPEEPPSDPRFALLPGRVLTRFTKVLGQDRLSTKPSCTQESMKLYTMALSSLDCSDFIPRVHAEVKDSDVRIASDAAVNRLLPIPDGVDLWSILEGKSSQVTGSGAPAPG
jgi:hypothetical protein